MARGTNVIRETSFVMAIEAKKGRATRIRHSFRMEAASDSSLAEMFLNRPHSAMPATVAIRQNRMQSIG